MLAGYLFNCHIVNRVNGQELAGFKPANIISATSLKSQLLHCINVYALYICGNNECGHIYHPEVVRTASEPKNKEQQEKHSRLPQSSKSRHVSTELPFTLFTQYKPDQAHSDSSHAADTCTSVTE